MEDFKHDEVIGRAAFRLCSVETPGGRKLVDAMLGGEYLRFRKEDNSWPPWFWAQNLVYATIDELQKAGWTIEPGAG